MNTGFIDQTVIGMPTFQLFNNLKKVSKLQDKSNPITIKIIESISANFATFEDQISPNGVIDYLKFLSAVQWQNPKAFNEHQ